MVSSIAAVYSARYISDRFLPDKAIDLMDEAASALRLAQESKPDELESLDRQIVTLRIELESLKNETDVFSVERKGEVEKLLADKKTESKSLEEIWQAGMRKYPILSLLMDLIIIKNALVCMELRTQNANSKKLNTNLK